MDEVQLQSFIQEVEMKEREEEVVWKQRDV